MLSWQMSQALSSLGQALFETAHVDHKFSSRHITEVIHVQPVCRLTVQLGVNPLLLWTLIYSFTYLTPALAALLDSTSEFHVFSSPKS